MTDLSDYEDGTRPQKFNHPPAIMRTPYTDAIRAPSKDGKIAGYTGIDQRRGRCYLSIRKRSKHLYRKETAYAISESIIGRLQAQHVEYVIIWEADQDRSLVWKLSDFANGEQMPSSHTPSQDGQLYCKVADAREEWTDEPTCPMYDVNPATDAADNDWSQL